MSINERLEKHVADLGVFYVKLHNYHWHVGGFNFKVVHEMTEEYYNSITLAYDEIAERLVQLGGKAPATMAHYLKLTSIKEESANEFTPEQVLKSVKADFEYLVEDLQKTRTEAAEKDDSSTDAILAGIIQEMEKNIWMLNATIK